MTAESIGVDDLSAVLDQRTTTVAMDFGRVSLDSDLILYPFGAPGQDRFCPPRCPSSRATHDGRGPPRPRSSAWSSTSSRR
jgi:hypothetical protein